jgi:hypothetical protein
MRTNSSKRPRALTLIAAIVLLGAALALAACGSSSSNSGTTNAAASTTSTTSGKDRRAAFRACLEKEGVKLPSAPTGGQPPTGGGGPPAGGAGGFLGGTAGAGGSSKTREAFKKCGGGNFGGGRFRNSAAFKATLTKFAACMRENGVNLPAPNTSGKGPVFNTKGIDTTSTAFKNAQTKCRSKLKGAFPGGGRPPGGTGQAPPEGAPAGEGAGA